MDIPTLLQHLDNKCTALQAKMQVSKDKGMLDLYEVFNKEWAETQISIRLLNKAQEDIHFYTNNEVKEKMKIYLLEEVPDLAMYFKTASINAVLSDAVEKAFERLSEEHFKNRIVNIIGGE
jgi:aspartate carbamoyltransferase regulatory subunit